MSCAFPPDGVVVWDDRCTNDELPGFDQTARRLTRRRCRQALALSNAERS